MCFGFLAREKEQNLRRLEAQRNDLNARVRLLRQELQLLQEPGSYVGEVVKALGKKKVLVKVNPEGKYIVDIDKDVDISKCTANTRVALRSDSYQLHKILPTKVDPLVSLMKVEKVPDSTRVEAFLLSFFVPFYFIYLFVTFLLGSPSPTTLFARYDLVGGLDKQIREIKEVIELPIKHPELFESLGVAQPKGVLMYGPPGTGKTLLARAVAHHTDCTFIRVSGAELVQKYIGEGSRMVRELFVMAREAAPSIIFMDEIDSIGSSRSNSGRGDSEVQARHVVNNNTHIRVFAAMLCATNFIYRHLVCVCYARAYKREQYWRLLLFLFRLLNLPDARFYFSWAFAAANDARAFEPAGWLRTVEQDQSDHGHEPNRHSRLCVTPPWPYRPEN